jgi:hypothetical protein
MRILLPVFTLLAVVLATSSADQNINYTQFDLFKNTGFTACPIDTKIAGGASPADFSISCWVTTQDQLCSYLTGTPVIIPTTPSQTAFFPWYPTYLLQSVSLSLSYVGLWLTLRSLTKQQGSSFVRTPFLFWIQLPLDAVRVIAFLVKSIHGFADAKRFAWINVLLWLLPFTYLFIIRLASQPRYISSQYTYKSTPQGVEFQTTKSLDQKLQAATQAQTTTLSGAKAWKASPTRWRIVAICAFLATVLLFSFSLAATILHWQFHWTSPGTALDKQTYIPISSALSNPSTLGLLPPDPCITYLTSGSLSKTDFFSQNTEQITFAVITTVQFTVSLSIFSAVFSWTKNPFSRASMVLIHSAVITGLGLLIPAFAVGMLIVRGKGTVVRFTNDLGVTGGCTFAFLGMKRELGYWDVKDELAFRVAMSFFGAS